MSGELLHELLDAAPAGAVAIAERGRPLRYRDVTGAGASIAAWLRERGVGPGDRVLLSLTRARALDTPSWVYGCSLAGAVFCVLHEQVVGPALAYVLDDAAPAMVVSDNPKVLGQAVAHGVQAVGPDTALVGAPPLVRAGGGSGERPGTDPGAPVCMIYTSGSTSRPKAIVSTHAQMTFVARAIQSRLRYRPGDVVYTTQPFSFDVGLYQIFLAALCGAQVWLPGPLGAGVRILPELLESRATVFPAVPAVAQTLAAAVARSDVPVPVPRLRLLTNTGAAMPRGVLASLRERLPGLRVQLMYGLTECKRVSIMPVDGDLERPGSSGLPLPGTRVTIVDAEGRPLPAGEVGEIVVSGPHVMNGYWNQEELTADRFRPSGLRTGDFGHLDPDGYLYVEGRRDDVYKQSGFRVSATEVEAAALELPGVRMAVVLPPKADGGDAVLVVTGDTEPALVRKGLAHRLEQFKVPKRCVVLDELPLNQNGKIDKKLLATIT
ncbi:class I adenylate-forming enzyme family protein [Nonomuraea gerenzanensis]|uniref:Long-chain-fatty-acid--CoA ligase n=1 Tax=Nonomuraea gerenzanensis TaxID=93944 RepID=A0A1M4E8K7_9ACTN|nr:AMP-binding protein [Nonomuraea gerenzanensis]UBU17403.1 AMP-binding protein [Nonomuraea gerenzanensis]SBO95156.1 Long-chain-fatty-acid--CoA ligase [Nonomuraea gerenzanensis]